MGRSSALLAFLGLLLFLRALSPISAKEAEPKYTPPDLATAGYINYPVNSIASGVSSLRSIWIALDGLKVPKFRGTSRR
jgi:hypothetical protein